MFYLKEDEFNMQEVIGATLSRNPNTSNLVLLTAIDRIKNVDSESSTERVAELIRMNREIFGN